MKQSSIHRKELNRSSTYKAPLIQPKLAINQPGDQYEQEAYRVADQVMRREHIGPVHEGPLPIQRMCSECEEEQNIQRKSSDCREDEGIMAKSQGGLPGTSEQFEQELHSSRGGGQTLAPDTQNYMSQSFGRDFSQVRIHTGNKSSEMNRSIQAKAFTHGSDIYFNSGQYNPNTQDGKHLLAHELTHVVQQKGGSATTKIQRSIGDVFGGIGLGGVAGALAGAGVGAIFGETGWGALIGAGAGAILGGIFSNPLMRLFGRENYSEEELAAYLTHLKEKDRIEGEYDSDNKARMIAKGAGESGNLSLRIRELLIRELLDGITSGGDEDAILLILNNSKPGERQQIIDKIGLKEIQENFGKGKKAKLDETTSICYDPDIPQPSPSAREPEKHPTYSSWIQSFHGLKSFDSMETYRFPRADGSIDIGQLRTSSDVLGDEAADRDSSFTTGVDPNSKNPPPDHNPVHTGDRFIDHPTLDWVNACLPANLREIAYELKSDCADIAVMLYHVYLTAHKKAGVINECRIGDFKGRANQDKGNEIIEEIYSGNVRKIVNPYTENRKPILSYQKLQSRLKPGDILVWEHHEDYPESKRRTGGHTQTIMHIEKDTSGKIKYIDCLQGNQPIFKKGAEEIVDQLGKENKEREKRGEAALPMPARTRAKSIQKLRDAPGRRIELSRLEKRKLRDKMFPGNIKSGPSRTEGPIWTWPDGHTTLVVAGPPKEI